MSWMHVCGIEGIMHACVVCTQVRAAGRGAAEIAGGAVLCGRFDQVCIQVCIQVGVLHSSRRVAFK